MEVQHIRIQREEIEHSHSGQLALRVFGAGKLMYTVSSIGQVQIYSREKDNWVVKSCTKLYDCPIVVNDVIWHLGRFEFVLVGFDGTIKICQLKSNYALITTQQLNLQLHSPVVSCCWGIQPNQFFITSQDRQLIQVNVAHNKHNNRSLGPSEPISVDQGLPLLRRGLLHIYLGDQQQISTICSGKLIIQESVGKKLVLRLGESIVDFAVSAESLFKNIVVLTQTSLYFYLQDDKQIVQISSFKVGEATCSTIGWGSNFSELGLYQTLKGYLKTRFFFKQLTGIWKQESCTDPNDSNGWKQ